MARIFAYIAHRGGVADDSAAELAAAARKIDAGASPTAIVTGWGAELDSVCDALRGSYAEVWKIANEALAYPNAELSGKPWSMSCRRAALCWLPTSISESIWRPAFPSS